MLSRIFKIIVDIVVVLCVVCVLALVIPPLVGVTTVISKPAMDSNYSEGSVAYGTRVAVSTLNVDDEIIYSGDTYAYIYSVDSVNTDLAEVGVTDKTTNESGTVQISKSAVKKAVVIPMIGYIMIAMDSSTGKAMLIGAAALLVMLFITAELLNRDRKNAKKSAIEKKWDEENKEDEYFAALAESMEQPIDESKFTVSKPSPSASANKESSVSSETKVITKPLKTRHMDDEFILEPNDSVVPTKIVDNKKPDNAVSDIENTNVDVMLKELRGESSEKSSMDTTGAAYVAEIDMALAALGSDKAQADEKPEKATDKTAKAASDKAASDNDEKQGESRFDRARRHRERSKDEGHTDKASSEAIDTEYENPSAEESSKAAAAAPATEEATEEESYKYIPPAHSNVYNTDNIAAAFNEVPDDDSPATHDLSESEIPDVSAALIAALNTTQVSRSERTFQAQTPAEPEASEDDVSEVELAIPVRTAEEIVDAAYAQGLDPAVTTDSVTGVKIIDFSDCLI